jgi:hypothetical protein
MTPLSVLRVADNSPLLFLGERGGYLDIHHFPWGSETRFVLGKRRQLEDR